MKNYLDITKNDKEQIIKLYYEKKSFENMIQMLQISERGIKRVLKESGINTRLKNRYTINDNYFETIDNEYKAYILGLLYADGFVGNEHYNNISLSLQEQDLELLQQIKSLLGYTGELRKMKRTTGSFDTKNDTYVLNFSNSKMAQDLRNIGLYPGKSLTLNKIPNIPENLIRHFLRGYFDGDGSFCVSDNTSICKTNNKTYSYKRGIFSFIATYEFIINSLEYFPCKKYNISPSRTEGMFYIKISSKSDVIDIYHFLYDDSNIKMARKFNKYTEFIGAITDK